MSDHIHYRAGYKYQLRGGYSVRVVELADPAREPIMTDWIELWPDGTMAISPGYAWDGASGPTYDSKDSMRASLIHDALYQLMRMGLVSRHLRRVADDVFYRVCLEDGMMTVRAWGWYQMVRIFADPATDPALETPDQCAPSDCGGMPHAPPPSPIRAP